MRLWLVRHARPVVEPGVCYGRLDIAADPLATANAARALCDALPATALALRCSPARRCGMLADAVCAQRPDLGLGAVDARIAEMDFGSWEGQRWDDIPAADMGAWTRDFADHQPGGGESVRGFMARVKEAWKETLATGVETVWFTHAGVIRATRLIAAGHATVTQAHEWPREAPAFGQWDVLSLAP